MNVLAIVFKKYNCSFARYLDTSVFITEHRCFYTSRMCAKVINLFHIKPGNVPQACHMISRCCDQLHLSWHPGNVKDCVKVRLEEYNAFCISISICPPEKLAKVK